MYDWTILDNSCFENEFLHQKQQKCTRISTDNIALEMHWICQLQMQLFIQLYLSTSVSTAHSVDRLIVVGRLTDSRSLVSDATKVHDTSYKKSILTER